VNGNLEVLAPVAGTATPIADVPDAVFSGSIVGPGIAVMPDDSPGASIARAPVDGVLMQLRNHAFIVQAADGRAILTHLGIDTVELDGEGFTLCAANGDAVEAGQPIIHWDPAAVRDSGRSPIVPVVALDVPPEALTIVAPIHQPVMDGDALFTLSAPPPEL
jgi:PTS system N-acetylglucosamine-specific IIA component